MSSFVVQIQTGRSTFSCGVRAVSDTIFSVVGSYGCDHIETPQDAIYTDRVLSCVEAAAPSESSAMRFFYAQFARVTPAGDFGSSY